MAWLLTFHCYGTHLPGHRDGSVERTRAGRGGFLEPSEALEHHAVHLQAQPAYHLTLEAASVVLSEIRRTCDFRGWTLLAAHVRSTHVHAVIDGPAVANQAAAEFKTYASRALNRIEGRRNRWSRGCDTRLLKDPRSVENAIQYVGLRQGTPMAVYVAPLRGSSE